MKEKEYMGKVRIRLIISLLFIALLLPTAALAEDEIYGEALNEEVPVLTEASAKGRVLEVLEITQENVNNYEMERETLLIEILSGPLKGENFITDNVKDPNLPYNIDVEKGQKVVLYLVLDESNQLVEGYVTERARDSILLVLLVFFIGLLVLIGGLKGFRALIALTLTMLAILKILLPAILLGYSPILVSILISIGVILVSIPLIAGWNKKAVSAIVGTFSGVLIAGILAYVVSVLAGLTGLSMDEASMLSYIPQNIELNFVGLLFATNILGALGAVMDVAVSISSAIWELKQVNPALKTQELIHSGMNIGRDIIGTMANTLILAYSGSGLYMLLLFMAYDMPFFEIVNIDAMSTEIVRALAGSIGLVLTIPITALMAGLMFGKEKIGG
jgi:uncharacterized membrane protein